MIVFGHGGHEFDSQRRLKFFSHLGKSAHCFSFSFGSILIGQRAFFYLKLFLRNLISITDPSFRPFEWSTAGAGLKGAELPRKTDLHVAVTHFLQW